MLSSALAACAPALNARAWQDPIKPAGVTSDTAAYSYNYDPHKAWKGPAIQSLINHITCRLVNDYIAREERWKRLKDYQFVAAIDLQVMVTQNEGLNPSVSSVKPLAWDGKTLYPYSTSSGSVSSTYNRTLTVSGQLTGAQTNTVTLDYVIDLARLFDEVDKYYDQKRGQWNEKLKAAANSDGLANILERCDQETHDFNPLRLISADIMFGDLGLAEDIDDGLGTIDSVAPLDIFGSSGPTNPADISPSPLPSGPAQAYNQKNSSTKQNFLDLLLGGAKPTEVLGVVGGAKQAPKVTSMSSTSAGSQAAPTSFAAASSFQIVAGAGVNPVWTLLLSKGPGSSGGGGGGGGGASSGGAGGGGGGQFLSYSHNAQDTLTITFQAVCKKVETTAPEKIAVTNPEDDNSLRNVQVTLTTNSKTSTEPPAPNATHAAVLTGIDFTFTSGDIVQGSGSAYVVMHFADRYENGYSFTDKNEAPIIFDRYGTANWTMSYVGPKSIQISAVVSNASTKQQVGTIVFKAHLKAETQNTLDIPVSENLSSQSSVAPALYSTNFTASHFEDAPTRAYWDTLPPCDVLTGADIQGSFGGAVAANKLQRLQSALSGQ